MTSAAYASPIDAARYGVYAADDTDRAGAPSGRVTADGSSGFPAASGRYHLYAGRFSPWSHRVELQLALNRLDQHVGISYVDSLRDGRGWAFRAGSGGDPVNGFTLLRQAYEASDPGYSGPVRLPVLWDRETGRIVSDDYRTIGLDLATEFGAWSAPETASYPEPLRRSIDELDRWLATHVDHGIWRAAWSRDASADLMVSLHQLNRRLAGRRYLLGDHLTAADVQLWVSLVRYDVGPNAHGRAGLRLDRFPELWAYARDVYTAPAFRRTTDFSSFRTPLAPLADWDEPTDRARLCAPDVAAAALGEWFVAPTPSSAPRAS